MINRRSFIAGLTGLIASPAIIRTIDLMPIKPIKNTFLFEPELYFTEFEVYKMLDEEIIKPGMKLLLTNQTRAKYNSIYTVTDNYAIIRTYRPNVIKSHSKSEDLDKINIDYVQSI